MPREWSEWTVWLLVATGGALGATSRFAVSSWANQVWPQFPLGTLLVNVLGCFLLGLMAALTAESTLVTPQMKALLGAGFLGALTTFSTFGLETFQCVERGQPALAVTNVVANLVLGLVAVWLGHALIKSMLAGN